MNLLFCNRIVGVGMVAAACLFMVGSRALAQDQPAAATEGVKVKPYAGPPIYLDEPEVVVAPSLVRRETVQEKYEGSDKLRTEREIAHYSDNSFDADGIYREFYPNGQLFVEGRFRKGRQHGEWTYYFDNGQLNRKAAFNVGKPDGAREVYRADGTLSAKRNFRDGKRDGQWITYDDTGTQPIAEEHYDNGKPDGVWKSWHPNGQLKQQVSFKQGERHGASTEWDDKGAKRVEATYVDGKLHGAVSRWFPDGRKVVQQFEAGRLVSQSSR